MVLEPLVRITTGDGGKQVRQLFPFGGFLDADEALIHFGLGKNDTINRMEVEWPSGHTQAFTDLAVNQRFIVTEPEGKAEKKPPIRTRKPTSAMFEESIALAKYPHQETEFDDFDIQPLLPFELSQLGPGQAWGDIDGDGDLDMFLAGAAGQAGQLFTNSTQKDSGEILLTPRLSAVLTIDSNHEDMGATFFDADGDGDLDLYVASGSTEFDAGSAALRDRLYLNTGSGDFERAPDGHLPLALENSGTVAPADFDRDGDIDLFIGSRSIPGDYPMAPRSHLLVNEGGRFIEATATLAPELQQPGMVTSALWSDIDNDGWLDLLLTNDWGPIRLFRNQDGQLKDDTEGAGLDGDGIAGRGWWSGIDGRDLDHDGDIDYVVTNLGRNTEYRAELKSPELIFYGDFDNTGKRHIVEARFLVENGEQICYPRRGFMESMSAMPYIADKMQTYHNFASVSIDGIYEIEKLNKATVFRANNMDSSVLINDGTGKFTFVPLPHLAQNSPAYGVVLRDVDLDGHTDCYLVQNFYHPHEEIGEIRSGLSLLLRGTGKTESPFQTVWPKESGIEVPGDAKSVAAVDLNGDGREDFVVGVNDSHAEIFINRSAGLHPTHPLVVHLDAGKGNPLGTGTRVTATAGDLAPQTAEVGGGGSYLTQSGSSLVFAVPDSAPGKVKLNIRWPDGSEETKEVDASARTVTLRQAGDQ